MTRRIRRSFELLLARLTSLALASGATSCGQPEKPAAARPNAADVPVPVHTAAARTDDVPLQVQAIGWIEPYASVTVKPQVEGQITEIHFVDGQDVSAGDVLYTIDSRSFVAALRLAQANLLRNQALAEDAEREAARVADLSSRRMAADRERDQTRAAADAARAQVQADQAAVENAKLRVEYCTIHSPMPGRVGARLVDTGNIVKANETALVTINQLSPIYVTFSVAERHLSAIRKWTASTALAVEARYENEDVGPTVGRLTFIDNRADSTTGMVRLKATFDNTDHQLWPGRFVNVTVTVSVQRGAVVVPTEAVQTGQNGSFLYVVSADQRAELRRVECKGAANENTIVLSGVNSGEEVVTDGQLRLKPGQKIEIKRQTDRDSPGRSGENK